jgi:hypothetical protein
LTGLKNKKAQLLISTASMSLKHAISHTWTFPIHPPTQEMRRSSYPLLGRIGGVRVRVGGVAQPTFNLGRAITLPRGNVE